MLELKRRLVEDGLDQAASDDVKLRHLWSLYVKTEVTFISVPTDDTLIYTRKLATYFEMYFIWF